MNRAQVLTQSLAFCFDVHGTCTCRYSIDDSDDEHQYSGGRRRVHVRHMPSVVWLQLSREMLYRTGQVPYNERYAKWQ